MCETETLPFELETELERRIVSDKSWREGVEWGSPRPGHPEGAVKFHIADVLWNVDRFYGDSPDRAALRLIALVHDTFKHQVDARRPATGENHHGMRARRFAERFLDDRRVLDVIELHDEAYNSWQNGNRDAQWDKAERRIQRLLDRLGENVGLYLAFFRCDNVTGDKSPASFEWFQKRCDRSGEGEPGSSTAADALPPRISEGDVT